jgi:hypothetical protein
VNQVPIRDLEHALQTALSAEPRFQAREKVYEDFGSEVVWAGEVLVFKLLDHPSARLCYAWEVDGHVTTVLGDGGRVKNGRDAVRAAIMAA